MQWYGAGVWFYGFSVVFKSILNDFGWTRAVTAGAFSLARLEGGLEGPIVGWLVDRIGPRRMALFGGIVAGIGYVLLSRMNSLAALYILFGVVIAFGYNAGFSHAGATAVANWFVRKRGRALGLFALGAGVGGATIVPLISVLITQFGWRTTVAVIGIAMWVIVTPLSFVLRHKPEQYGQYPDGEPPDAHSLKGYDSSPEQSLAGIEVRVAPDEDDFTWREALKTSTFWLMMLGASARSIGMSSVVLHQIAFLTDIGISETAAAAALGMMVAISIPSRLFFGWLGDRMDKRYVMMTTYLLQAVGVFILANVRSIDQVYIFLVVFGIGYGGAIPVFIAMRGEYFGRKAFATIQGLMRLFLMIPTVIGPVFAGYVYDTTGSYYYAFVLFTVLYVIGAIVIAFAKRPVKHHQPG